MPHIHWVARQNKLEIPNVSPNDEEEVNTREIHLQEGPKKKTAPGGTEEIRKDTFNIILMPILNETVSMTKIEKKK